MILVCPTAFKGTLTAAAATEAMLAGARRAAPDRRLRPQPLSDGGNGLLEALEAAAGGKGRAARVAGPLGTSVTARYLVQDQRAVVETAEACGLHLVPPPLRDPLRASTRGVGELLLAAATVAPDDGSEDGRLIVGLGGSATVDAGAGMVSALGWRLLDAAGDPVPPGPAGLHDLARIEPPDDPPRLPPLVVLADVTNPLLGPSGAVPVFAPQKGAGGADLPRLNAALERWAEVVGDQLGADVAGLPGAGAAGGLGAAFAAFLGVAPRPGSDWVLEIVGFDAALAEADVVVTGEGRWDAQSPMGKATGEVVRRAGAAGVPVLLVAGAADAPVPDGVTLVTGRTDGRGVAPAGPLDADALSRIVAESLPGLLPGARGS